MEPPHSEFYRLADDGRVWRTAVDWLIVRHESSLDIAAEKELIDWLESDPAHQAAYEEAFRLWLLMGGLIPPSNPQERGNVIPSMVRPSRPET
jgi:ferric-dicitrate binding protein FerR (iron transport regulator)